MGLCTCQRWGRGKRGDKAMDGRVLMEQVACCPPGDGDSQKGAVKFSTDSG